MAENWRIRFVLATSLLPVAGGPAAAEPAERAPAPVAQLDKARALIEAGHYREARDLARQFLARQEPAPAAEGPETAAALDLLVEATWLEGWPWDGVLDAAQRAVRIREASGDVRDGKLAASLDNLCAVQLLLSDPEAARQTCGRSVTVREQTLGLDHPDVAAGLNGLAMALINLGKFAEARPVCDRALALREASQDSNPLGVAESLITRGYLRQWTTDFVGARVAYEKALAIREKALPPDHPLVAEAVQKVGFSLYQASDLSAARTWLERALAMRRRAYGSEHPQTASSLWRYAALLQAQGDLSGARSAAEDSLRIREQVFGRDHVVTIVSRLQVGAVLRAQEDLPSADSVLAQALDSAERTLGPEHPRLASILTELMSVVEARGEHARATQLGERALAIREKALGPSDQMVATTLLFLLGVAWEEERYDVVLERSLRAASIARVRAADMARQLAEREALRYVEAWRPALERAVTVVAEPGLPRVPADATSQVWDEIVRSRALVLDESAARHRFALDTADAETTALLRRLDEARGALSTLMSAGPDPSSPDLLAERLRVARADEERSERALAAKISGARDDELQRDVTFAQVAAALPRDAALIAYLRYERWPPTTPAGEAGSRVPGPPTTPYYFALVLRSGGTPVAVTLGAAAEIDARVKRWREEVASAPRDGGALGRYRSAGERLREAIWDPVASRLAGVGQVFIVPEGTINLVNLATLPVGSDRYLVDEGMLLHYLTSERDLVRLPASRQQAPTTDGLLLFGGPDYDSLSVDRRADSATKVASSTGERRPADPGRPATHPAYRGPTSTCARFRELRWEPLPGALAEVDEIRDLWKSPRGGRTGGGGEADVFVGPLADESTFKAVVSGYRIVHLATHAFFEGDGCGDADTFEDSPLLLSGLAFAGANRRNDPAAARGQDDGVLTAEEVASLDLRGVEWVVLSACGTGIGPIESGEGVMGLRRAFQIAGARSVMTSLWSVDDNSAREWARRLYESRRAGRSTAESVRDASLGLLEARRRAGVATHPFSWGAFVAAGDWR